LRAYENKEELKLEINKAFGKYISEFEDIPESLKDKRDRYIYLVKRSNLKCTMIDIPDDAIGRVDSNGKLTKPEYAEIYDEVNAHKGTLKSMLFSGIFIQGLFSFLGATRRLIGLPLYSSSGDFSKGMTTFSSFFRVSNG